MNIISVFTKEHFHSICDELASKDDDLKAVITMYGYPPLWSRPNTFETLVHVILEQQVSLASALAALKKLQKKTGSITPQNILAMNDEELRACYVSRQKTVYLRDLASALQNKNLNLAALKKMPDDDIRAKLLQLKGVGNWTIDVYLMFVLKRADVFPAGDLAAVNALKRLKQLPKETSREEMIKITKQWMPNRTIASFILWHYYLSVAANKKLVNAGKK
ncbi:MAG: DNA-3-methyladenine glycosylase 2 family protein [Ginsengibacter sp.]